MDKQKIRQFLSERPLLTPTGVGIEAGYAEGRAFRNEMELGRPMPDDMAKRLLPVLEKYGWEEG